MRWDGKVPLCRLWRHRHHSNSATTRKFGCDHTPIRMRSHPNFEPCSNARTASSAPPVLRVIVWTMSSAIGATRHPVPPGQPKPDAHAPRAHRYPNLPVGQHTERGSQGGNRASKTDTWSSGLPIWFLAFRSAESIHSQPGGRSELGGDGVLLRPRHQIAVLGHQWQARGRPDRSRQANRAAADNSP
jgi:hypothetical protein